MSKYILYKAKSGQTQDEGVRKLTQANQNTSILYEVLDYSRNALPRQGDRPVHPVSVKDSLRSRQIEGGTTHSRDSDWVVDTVEVFEGSGEEFDQIVICWCLYQPIDAQLVEVVNGDRGKFFYDLPKRELQTV